MDRNLSVEFRPQVLNDFIGCESITQPIAEGLAQGRVDSTYLFFGPPGCGKTSMARVVAKLLNGEQEEYDIIEPDVAELGVDEIRYLISKARLNPWSGKFKCIILDEAHKLGAPAQLILLKAIEEPVSSTVWFICSSEPSKLSEAIRRRGVTYIMPPLNPDQIDTLVKSTITRVGGTVADKYLPICKDLTKALIEHETTSPGFIVRAIEKFITGVPAIESAQVIEVTTVDTIAIARAAASGDWEKVKTILSTAPRSAARDIRSAVSGYFRAILLKQKTGDRAERCVWAIQQLGDLANQNQFEEGLIWASTCAALYLICVGQKNYKEKKG